MQRAIRRTAAGTAPTAVPFAQNQLGSAQFGDELLHVRNAKPGDQVVAGAGLIGAVGAGHDVTETVRAEQRIEQRVQKRQ